MCSIPLRIPDRGDGTTGPDPTIIVYASRRPVPALEKYAAEASRYDRRNPLVPLRLVGDNAGDQICAVLLAATRAAMERLEGEAGRSVCGLGRLRREGRALGPVAFERLVEGVWAEFGEGRERIYNKLAWEHGPKLAGQVFDRLKSRERWLLGQVLVDQSGETCELAEMMRDDGGDDDDVWRLVSWHNGEVTIHLETTVATDD